MVDSRGETGTQSLKNANSYDGMAWDGDSLFHQKHDFPSHVTEPLLSPNSIFWLVKE